MLVVRLCPYGGQRNIGTLEAMSMPKALFHFYLPKIGFDKSEPLQPRIFFHFSSFEVMVIQRYERNKGFDEGRMFLC